MDRLVVAMREGQGKEAVEPILKFLETYVRQHFRAEEQWMTMTRYPGESAHRAEHAAFMNELAAMKAAWAKQGSNPALAIEVQRKSCGWLREHIGRTDRALGAWLGNQAPNARV